MPRKNSAFFALIALCACASVCAAPGPTISTFKNGQVIGIRATTTEEVRAAATAMATAFEKDPPNRAALLGAAKAMTAKARCFNLYMGRVAMASIQAGKIDASANSEAFLQDSIATLSEVNDQTQVKCEMK